MEIDWGKWTVRLILSGALLTLAIILNSCDIMKLKRSNRQQVNAVSASKDTSSKQEQGGSVSSSENKSAHDYEWFRWMLPYIAKGGDTTINNFYSQPAAPPTIIYEGGKGRMEQENKQNDSSWYLRLDMQMRQMYDSLAAKMESKDKMKEVKGPNLWDYLGMAALVLVIIKFLTDFKIVRR